MAGRKDVLETGHFEMDPKRVYANVEVPELRDFPRFHWEDYPGLKKQVQSIWRGQLVRQKRLVWSIERSRLVDSIEKLHSEILETKSNILDERCFALKGGVRATKLKLRAALAGAVLDMSRCAERTGVPAEGCILAEYDLAREEAADALSILDHAVLQLLNAVKKTESTAETDAEIRDWARLCVRAELERHQIDTHFGINSPWNHIQMQLEHPNLEDAEEQEKRRKNLRDELRLLVKRSKRGNPQGRTT